MSLGRLATTPYQQLPQAIQSAAQNAIAPPSVPLLSCHLDAMNGVLALASQLGNRLEALADRLLGPTPETDRPGAEMANPVSAVGRLNLYEAQLRSALDSSLAHIERLERFV